MRKIIGIVGAAIIVAAGALPAGAGHERNHWEDVSFEAPVPCQVYCAYWLDAANTDIDGDGEEDIRFQACEAPFPDGSYDDIVVRAPSNTNILEFEIRPLLDWDAFVCTKPAVGNNGEEIGVGANVIGENCDGILGPNDPSGTGCVEIVTAVIVPGQRYVLRAYNWQDIPYLQGRYRFIRIT